MTIRQSLAKIKKIEETYDGLLEESRKIEKLLKSNLQEYTDTKKEIAVIFIESELVDKPVHCDGICITVTAAGHQDHAAVRVNGIYYSVALVDGVTV